MKGTRISKPNVKISMMISVVLAIAEKLSMALATIDICYTNPACIDTEFEETAVYFGFRCSSGYMAHQ